MDDAAVERFGEQLRRAAQGDGRAFEELVRAHQSMVFSIACHFLGDPAEAEELAQEVFMELYRSLGKIKSPSHLRFWLRRVATHRSIDRLRRQEPHQISLDDAPDLAAPDSMPDDPLLEEKLRRVLLTLPPRERMAVILRFQEDLELHEIAEVMEMPVNTVKSCLRRSLAVLQSKLVRIAGGVRV